MKITREVIRDLLPLYLADELSADTRALIEKYLETDLELAKIARQQKEALELPGEIPIPINEETQIKAFRKAKIIYYMTIIILGLLMAGIFVIIMLAFFVPS